MTLVTPVTRGASVLAVALALGVSGGVVPVLTATAASAGESYPVPSSGTFRLSGLGFGHGIGMSQFGAEGMGRLGKSYRQILRFYYPGTKFDKVSSRRTIRVLLSGVNRSDSSGTSVVVKPRKGLRLVNGGKTRELPSRVGGGPVTSYRVVRKESSLAVFANGSGASDRVAAGLKGTVRFSTSRRHGSSRVAVVAATGSTRTYRGFLDIRRSDSGLVTMSHLLLQDYLRSVVSSEVPSNWTPAALRAQAVAARSYALLAQVNARADGRAYDICDTTSCQAYGAIGTESGPETDAVRATARIYLKSGGKPALTMFSSANGGYTVSGSRSYLVAKPDPYDGVVTGDANWGHSWTEKIKAKSVQRAWPQVGKVRSIRVLGRDGNGQWDGRTQSVAIVGSKDRVSVSADSFRWALGLKSTWWAVTNVSSGEKAAPRKVRTAARDQGVKVRWAKPRTDKAIRRYEVTVKPGDRQLRVPGEQHSTRVRGLTNGREYQTKVRAVYRSGPGPATPGPAAIPISAYSYYRAISPKRLLEVDRATSMSSGGARTIALTGRGILPESRTRAAILRVSVSGDGEVGRVMVWPKDAKQRQTVAAIYPADSGTHGVVSVPVNSTGKVSVGTTTKSKRLTVDVLGYHTASGVSSKAIRTVPVHRVVSSSADKAWSGGRLRQGEPRTVRIAGRGAIPDNVRTVVVNISLVHPTARASLSTSPTGTSPSLGSVVRAAEGEVRSATTIARLSSDGRLPLRLSAGRSHVAVDVLGWFTRQDGTRQGRFRSSPVELVFSPRRDGAVDADQSRTVKVRGEGTGVPGKASSVALNVIARSRGGAGSVSVTPAGAAVVPRPLVSFGRRGAVRNIVVVPVGTDGRVRVHASDAKTEVTVQVIGWYS